MAQYTIEISEVVAKNTNTFSNGTGKVFNFDYDFYDETKKEDFETKFLNHFRYREIGVETIEQFQHNLKCKCDETLTYYNEVLKVALVEYDLINNYDVTETFEKTASNVKVIVGDTENTLVKNADIVVTLNTENNLDSTTTHVEAVDVLKSDTQNETGTNNNSTVVSDNIKKVESDTPSGLLSIGNIEGDIYASKVNMDATDGTKTETLESTAEKTLESTEATTRNVTDSVNAASSDTGTNSTAEDTTETNTGVVNQNQTDNGSENYLLKKIGNIGVDAPSDMMRKHLEFQKVVRQAYLNFFIDCEELFMQLY